MKMNYLLLVSLLSFVLFSCNGSTEKEQAMEMLQASLEEINEDIPQQVDEVTTWLGCTLEEPYFVYNYSISGKDLEEDPIDILYENSDAFRENLAKSIKNDVFVGETQNILIKAGYGIRYHYTATTSTYSIDFDFTPEQIAEM